MKQRFEQADVQTKNMIMQSLGARIIIKDMKLNIKLDTPLKIIRKANEEFKSIEELLEPIETQTSEEREAIFASINPIWGN